MQIVRSAHDNGVEILLLLEKFAEVTVSRAAAVLAGALQSTVIGVHDFLTRFAACNAARDFERVGQPYGLVRAEPIPPTIDAQQFADRIAKLMGFPLWMVRADLIRITDGDALHLGLAQKAEHDAQALRANADERNVDPIAGWNISCAAQHATRYYREAKRRGGALRQELAS